MTYTAHTYIHAHTPKPHRSQGVMRRILEFECHRKKLHSSDLISEHCYYDMFNLGTTNCKFTHLQLWMPTKEKSSTNVNFNTHIFCPHYAHEHFVGGEFSDWCFRDVFVSEVWICLFVCYVQRWKKYFNSLLNVKTPQSKKYTLLQAKVQKYCSIKWKYSSTNTADLHLSKCIHVSLVKQQLVAPACSICQNTVAEWRFIQRLN